MAKCHRLWRIFFGMIILALLSSASGLKAHAVGYYVRSDGLIVPARAYRYISSRAELLPYIIEGGFIPAAVPSPAKPHRATYIGFMKFDEAETAAQALQVPHDAAIRLEFDTFQVAEDLRIPKGRCNKADYPEPITTDYPEFGPGGAVQAITNLPILVDCIVDLRNHQLLYARYSHLCQ